jgi:hypothetical protein
MTKRFTQVAFHGPIENYNKGMEALCHVCKGVYERLLPLAGITVRCMRRLVEQSMNLDPNCGVVINGVEVDDDYVISSGSEITFIKPAGCKGLGDLLTPAQIKRRWKISETQYRELCTLGLPTIRLAGEPRHPEEAVDEWFRRLFGRSAEDAPAPPLRPRERRIVEALAEAGEELKAATIATRANLPDNSNLRTMLANLVRQGILVKGVGGYGLGPGVRP